MERILVVNVNWRGDVLFSTAFIRTLRENYPYSFIATLLAPRCKEILENNPYLNEIIIFDEQGRQHGLLGKLKLIRLLRKKRFDTAFLLHRSFTRTLICWLAGIPQRIGYYTRKRAILLTESIPPPKENMHKADYFLNIARSCQMKAESRDYQFFISDSDKEYIHQLLEKNGSNEDDYLVVINPGGNWQLKRWPPENFARVADRLIEDFQAKVIISGAQKDLPLAKEIISLMKHTPFVLCGQTSLKELAALMSRANLVISGDSGPMHIAVSQGAKVISLFGPTSAQITGPCGREENYTVLQKNVGCQIPCYQLDCADNRCMRSISVEDVLAAARRFQ